MATEQWIHPALRESNPTAIEEQSALEYATPLMIKYAYEKYRYNLAPREVYEILYEGSWEGVDDFVEYMQDMGPTPEGLRVYTFEELDAMDDAAMRKGECVDEEYIAYSDAETEDDGDDEEQVRVIRSLLEEGGEDARLLFSMFEGDEGEMETEEEELMMPLDPLPLYESQCGDDEAILESDMPPSFSPGPSPPEYTAQALVWSDQDEAAAEEDDEEEEEKEAVPEDDLFVDTLVEDNEYSEVETELEKVESLEIDQQLTGPATSQFWPSPLGTAAWTQDKISQSRRVFAATAIKVVPALMIMGTLFWKNSSREPIRFFGRH